MAADDLRKAMRRAFQLGQTYWMHADSESLIQHQKAEQIQGKFDALMEETVVAAAGVSASGALRVCPVRDALCVNVPAVQQCTDCPERRTSSAGGTDGR